MSEIVHSGQNGLDSVYVYSVSKNHYITSFSTTLCLAFSRLQYSKLVGFSFCKMTQQENGMQTTCQDFVHCSHAQYCVYACVLIHYTTEMLGRSLEQG